MALNLRLQIIRCATLILVFQMQQSYYITDYVYCNCQNCLVRHKTILHVTVAVVGDISIRKTGGNYIRVTVSKPSNYLVSG